MRATLEASLADINQVRANNPVELSVTVRASCKNLERLGAIVRSEKAVAEHATARTATARRKVTEGRITKLRRIYEKQPKRWLLLPRKDRKRFVDDLAKEMDLSPSRIRALLKIIISV